MKKVWRIFKCILLITTFNLLFSCMYTKVQMIEIVSLPDKFEYYTGEDLDVSGGTIKITYENQKTSVIKMTKQMVSNFDSNIENNKLELKVSYKGCETSFFVRVFGKDVSFNSKGLAFKPISDTECEVSIGIADIYYGLTRIVIPEIHNGLTVTKIAYKGFRDVETIEEVFIPKTVVASADKDYPHDAIFYGCVNLKVIEVDSENPVYDSRDNSNAVIVTADNTLISACQTTIIPHGVTSLYGFSFRNIPHLTSIVIPGSVQTIGPYAFADCINLKEITLEDGIETIYWGTFANCWSLEEVILPDSVTALGGTSVVDTFENCYSLKKIVISNNVNYLENNLFRGCDNLEEIVLPNTLDKIPPGFFKNFTGLKSITIPDSVHTIEVSAFEGLLNLETVVLSENLEYINVSAFADCANLKTVVFGNKVKEIGGRAFFGCKQLTSVILPDSVTKIGNNVFADCHNLEFIKLSSQLTSMGAGNFIRCYRLKTIELPNGLNTLSSKFFEKSYGIKALNIPASIETITDDPFADCIALSLFFESLTPATLIDVDFSNIDFLVVPDVAYDAYLIAWSSYQDKIVELSKYQPNNHALFKFNLINDDTAYEIALFEKYSDDCMLDIVIPEYYNGLPVVKIADYGFTNARNVRSLTISKLLTSIGLEGLNKIISLEEISVDIDNPVYDSRNNCNAIIETASNKLIIGCNKTVIDSSVTSIGSYAFSYNEKLTSITIPGNVVEIGKNSFEATINLKEIFIEEGVEKIDDYAFNNCSSLRLINLPSTLTEIGKDTFSKCNSLESIIIPGSVRNFGTPIFNECSRLKKVVLGEGITYIPKDMFYDCDSLREVIIPNTVTDIYYKAFNDCDGLYEIYIPDSVTNISNASFYNCKSLCKIRMSDNITEVSVIFDFSDWRYCIPGITMLCNYLKSVNIPNQLQTIIDNPGYAVMAWEKRIIIDNDYDLVRFGDLRLANTYIVAEKYREYVEQHYSDFALEIFYYKELN